MGLMTKLEVGTLIVSLVGVELIDGTKVCKGDIGIILENELVAAEHFYTNFDYKIIINGNELYVFEDEIAPYT